MYAAGYLLLDAVHPDYSGIISECSETHALYYPNNNLSIIMNDAETLAIVKVGGSNPNTLRNLVLEHIFEVASGDIVELIETTSGCILKAASLTSDVMYNIIASGGWNNIIGDEE